MNFAGLIYLVLAHFFSGRGFLRLFKLELKPIERFCLSFICGVPILSFAPCILQLLHIPITYGAVIASIAIFTLIFSAPLVLPYRKPTFGKIIMPQLYEWPFLLICLGLTILGVWRCYYYPPYPRDMLTGPELIAEYTVREKTMINSVFGIDLHVAASEASANIFKSPYITGLQIIYKLLVQPFGQIWMSVLFVPLIIWFYYLLRTRVHPFIASLALMVYFICPELYAYSYIMLYDYSSLIFFFCGFLFMTRYLEKFERNYLAWISVCFGIATYIRSENLILVGMIAPLLIFYYYKKKYPLTKAVVNLAIFMGVTAAFYFVCTYVFVKNFVPIKFNTATTINSNLGDISLFFQRLVDLSTGLIFSRMGYLYYGYFFTFFVALLAIDIIWQRKFSKEAVVLLYGIAVVYVGLAFLGYLFPFINLQNTSKRGLFRAMPLILMYFADSNASQRLSAFLKRWEADEPEKPVPSASKAKPTPAVTTPRPAPQRSVGKKK